MKKLGRIAGQVMAGAALLVLTACSDTPQKNTYKVYRGGVLYDSEEAAGEDTIFGKDGFLLLGETDDDKSGGPAGIGVNSYLWRASLDTLAFMPLSSADPFGGVIITDWFSPPESPLERFKMTVYILDRRLRADALKVSVFRQTRAAPTAGWNDSTIAKSTPIELENAILTRARQLRVAAVEKPE